MFGLVDFVAVLADTDLTAWDWSRRDWRKGQEMIRNSNQTWEIGQRVNVGFLKGLEVMEKVPTPGDYRPDTYILQAASGRRYEFTPHYGIARID